jgi:hypothetical protein
MFVIEIEAPIGVARAGIHELREARRGGPEAAERIGRVEVVVLVVAVVHRVERAVREVVGSLLSYLFSYAVIFTSCPTGFPAASASCTWTIAAVRRLSASSARCSCCRRTRSDARTSRLRIRRALPTAG